MLCTALILEVQEEDEVKEDDGGLISMAQSRCKPSDATQQASGSLQSPLLSVPRNDAKLHITSNLLGMA